MKKLKYNTKIKKRIIVKDQRQNNKKKLRIKRKKRNIRLPSKNM